MGKTTAAACLHCEQATKHPGYVFLASSNDYIRISRSRHPPKAVEEFKGTKGYTKAKGFPRTVVRSAWQLEYAFGPFTSNKAMRAFKMAWVRGDVQAAYTVLKRMKSGTVVNCYKFQ
jgi:hypothetical protein